MSLPDASCQEILLNWEASRKRRQSGVMGRRSSGRNRNANASNRKLSEEDELDVAEFVKLWILFGFPVKDTAFIFRVANSVLQRKGKATNELVSEGWPKGFLQRHAEVKVAVQEALDRPKEKEMSENDLDEVAPTFIQNLEYWIDELKIGLEDIYTMGELAFITTVVKQKKHMTLSRRTAINDARPFLSGVFCLSYVTQEFLTPFLTVRSKNKPSHKQVEGVPVTHDKAGWASQSHGLHHWLMDVFNPETKPEEDENGTRRCRLLLVDAHQIDRQTLADFQVSCWYEGILCLSYPSGLADRLNPLHLGVFDALGDNYLEHMRKQWRVNRQVKKKEEYSLGTKEFATYIKGQLCSRDYETKGRAAWSESRLVPNDPCGERESPCEEDTEDIIEISDDDDSTCSRESPDQTTHLAIEVPSQLQSPPQSSPACRTRPRLVKPEESDSESDDYDRSPIVTRARKSGKLRSSTAVAERTHRKRHRKSDKPRSSYEIEERAQRKRLRKLARCSSPKKKEKYTEKLLRYHLKWFVMVQAGRGILESMDARITG